jgi:hypothetical protein
MYTQVYLKCAVTYDAPVAHFPERLRSMSSNGSCSTAQQNQIIENYAGSLGVICTIHLSWSERRYPNDGRADLYVMTPTVLGSLTLPILLALFYLSNARQRRSPMFILVALATFLQIVQSVEQATVHVRPPTSSAMPLSRTSCYTS